MRKYLPSFAILFLSLAAGSCNSESIDQLCASRWKQFSSDVSDARSRIDAGSGRSPASEPPVLVEGERNRWKDWSVAKLTETQKFLDVLEPYPQHRDHMARVSRIADQLVAFYGYAELGDTTMMDRSLTRISSDEAALHAEICGK